MKENYMRRCPADCLHNFHYESSKPAAQKYTSNIPLSITPEIHRLNCACSARHLSFHSFSDIHFSHVICNLKVTFKLQNTLKIVISIQITNYFRDCNFDTNYKLQM